jgi:hypothetical protein
MNTLPLVRKVSNHYLPVVTLGIAVTSFRLSQRF